MEATTWNLCAGVWNLIKSKEDWTWYCRAIDLRDRDQYTHSYEPKQYPCKVSSYAEYNENGPNWINHDFIYQVEIVCEKCGHRHTEWEKEYSR